MRVISLTVLPIIVSLNQGSHVHPLDREPTQLSCSYSLELVRQYQTSRARFKQSKTYFNAACNETVQGYLSRSPRCLVHSVSPDKDTLHWLARLQRHLIVVEGVSCRGLLPSHYNVHLYCVEGGVARDKYQLRTQTLFRKLCTFLKEFPFHIYDETLVRRSNLMGVELTVTTLNYGQNIEDSVYGPPGQSSVGGVYGDIFMILKQRLNFTFTLHKPKDNKWGGKESGRKLGWNGMIGDIAEGIADFGIGAFTSTPQRNEVVKFSIGNLDVGKTFFIKEASKNSINLMIFLKPTQHMGCRNHPHYHCWLGSVYYCSSCQG